MPERVSVTAHADFGNVATWGYASFLKVTCGRLVCLARVDLAKCDLDGVVAIGFLSMALA